MASSPLKSDMNGGTPEELFESSQRPVSFAGSHPKQPNLTVAVDGPVSRRGSISQASPAAQTASRRLTPPPPSPAPSTLVTPPTPVDQRSPTLEDAPVQQLSVDRPHQRSQSVLIDDVASHSPPPDQLSHQRSRSASSATNHPSKLSQVTTSPLTPMIEERGGSFKDGANGGFFSSMISAAQTAASTLTNTIPNPLGNQTTSRLPEAARDSVEPNGSPAGEIFQPTSSTQGSQPAKAALGSGNLEFNDLDGEQHVSRVSTLPVPRHSDAPQEQVHTRETRASTDPTRQYAAGRQSGRDPDLRIQTGIRSTEPFPSAIVHPDGSDSARLSRSRGLSSVTNASSPGSLLGVNHEGSLGRSGSVKSRLARAGRKGRSGSVATNSSMAAGIVSTGTGLPGTPISTTSRSAGYPMASKKRNRDLHTSFKTLPLDDELVEDCGCALQKEILMQGRMYISLGHICFYSNIFGWVTQLAISFDEVMSVEKRNTAMVFPNAIAIQTLHNKYVFASFIGRDSTFEMIVALWRVGHPNLHVTESTVSLAKAESVDGKLLGSADGETDVSFSDDDGSYEYDDDYESEEEAVVEEKREVASATPRKESFARSPGPDSSRKTPAQDVAPPPGPSADQIEKSATAPNTEQDFPGPTSHAPSYCGDADKHYEKIIRDEVVPAPLGQIYSLLFGDGSAKFMEKWMVENQKVTELQLDDRLGLSMDHKSRTSSYIKPLYGAIGPSKTKCNVTEDLKQLDYEKAASVVITTLSPDVPSGNSFSVKTRYCMMWAEENSTRIIVNCTIDWTAKSWLKSKFCNNFINCSTGLILCCRCHREGCN